MIRMLTRRAPARLPDRAVHCRAWLKQLRRANAYYKDRQVQLCAAFDAWHAENGARLPTVAEARELAKAHGLRP